MGLQNGQPFWRDFKKDCFFLSARGGLGHLRRLPETVQRAPEDLPAGPRPPTHCYRHFSLHNSTLVGMAAFFSPEESASNEEWTLGSNQGRSL